MQPEDAKVHHPKIWDGEKWVVVPWLQIPPGVRLWLRVLDRPDSLYGGTGRTPARLFYKDWPTVAAVPTPDHTVELWKDGPTGYPYRVSWRHDGRVDVEMQTIVIDPRPDQEEDILRPLHRGGPLRFRIWHITKDDTDPRPSLLAGGWLEYNP